MTRRFVPVAALLAFVFSGNLAAQSETRSFADLSLEELMNETVTSVSKKEQPLFDSATAISVLTNDDLRRSGATTIPDALRLVPGMDVGAVNSREFAVSARGFNSVFANKLLVLMDGRPVYTGLFGGVYWDLQQTPMEDVDRVEVIKGPGATVWGANAVNGVVNIVTRKNFEGNELRGTVGTTAEGGGDSVKLEYTGGQVGDRWSTVYALQYGENEPVFATQRDSLSDLRHGPNGDLANPSLALVAISGFTGRNDLYPGQDVCNRFGYTTRTTASRGTFCGPFDQVAARSISNKNRYYSAYGYGTFDVSDNLQLFGSATMYDSQAKASSGIEFWSTSGDQFTADDSGNETSYYYDPELDDLVLLQRIFNPFELGGAEAATTKFDETTYTVMGGASGTLGSKFDWEASLEHSKYDYRADRPRLLSQAVHDYFLSPLLGYLPFGGTNYPIYTINRDHWFNPITPDIYRSMSTRVINEGDTSATTFNANITGDLFDMPAGAVGFAGVLEAARQTVDLRSDERTDQLRPIDDQTIYNLVSSGRTEGERNRYAAGVEFRVPIFSTLTAQLAARYDKYDDITAVDDAVTYNLGLEYRPFDNLLLRGSYATSFRAPDMQLVYAGGAASFSTIFDEYACRSGTGTNANQGPQTRDQCLDASNDPSVYQAKTLIAGNKDLEEEKGKSFSYGFVWDIIDGMTLYADYYRIKLEDAASQLGSDYILESEAACRLGTYADGTLSKGAAFCSQIANLITRTGVNDQITQINDAYINTALQDTSGVDATFEYKLDTDRLGTFGLNLGYSMVFTNKYRQFDDEPLIDYRDIPPSRNIVYPERSRVRGSVSWERGDWSAAVFGTRFGSVFSNAERSGTNAAGGKYGRRLQPWMLYNLQIGKRFSDSVKADFTVINVLNNQFREDNSFTGYPFFNYALGADPLGRRYTLSVTYKF